MSGVSWYRGFFLQTQADRDTAELDQAVNCSEQLGVLARATAEQTRQSDVA